MLAPTLAFGSALSSAGAGNTASASSLGKEPDGVMRAVACMPDTWNVYFFPRQLVFLERQSPTPWDSDDAVEYDGLLGEIGRKGGRSLCQSTFTNTVSLWANTPWQGLKASNND